MDRRQLLKLGALSGAILASPGLTGLKAIEHIQEKGVNSGYIHLKLNDLDIFIFSDGKITLNSPQPIFAPDINSKDVKEELQKIYLTQDKLESAINVMLVKTGKRTILIDTGSGYHFGENGGQLLNNLEKSGIRASDVTDVFITHAHIDHIGGIIKGGRTPVYPNARYHIAKKEYDFWMSGTPDFSKSKNPQTPKESVEFAREVLSSINDRLTRFIYGDILFSCLKPELAEGHTPGHTIFTVFSGDKSIKHIVDTFHTPLLVAKPEWGTQWDVDFIKGIDTRKQILADCYSDRTLITTTHLPWPGVGYIGRNGADYQWIPLSYFTPNEIAF